MLISFLPDTGCTQSIISESLASQLGASVDQNANIQLLTANGGSISVKGQAQLYLQHKHRTTITFAIVATGVSHPALISWHDLKYFVHVPQRLVFCGYTYPNEGGYLE